MNTPSLNMDKLMMRRAIQLARHGLGTTSPNPMVGAVIALPDGRIIGEGWHRRCGEGHAEVNAVASVADRDIFARGHNLRDPRTMLPLRTHASMLETHNRLRHTACGSRHT